MSGSTPPFKPPNTLWKEKTLHYVTCFLQKFRPCADILPFTEGLNSMCTVPAIVPPMLHQGLGFKALKMLWRVLGFRVRV